MIINMVVTYLALEQLPEWPVQSRAEACPEPKPNPWWKQWL